MGYFCRSFNVNKIGFSFNARLGTCPVVNVTFRPTLIVLEFSKDLRAIVRVCYSRSCKTMTPSDTLDSIDERNMRSIEDKVVNTSSRVCDLISSNLARLSPFAIYSYRMALSNSQATRERR